MNKERIILAVIAFVLLVLAVIASIATPGTPQPLQSALGFSGGATSIESGAPMIAPSSEAFSGNGSDLATPIMPPTPSTGAAITIPQQVEKHGDIDMNVDDANATTDKLTALASRYGGDVLTRDLTRDSNGFFSGDVTIRVSVKNFDSAMTDIAALGSQVLSQNVTSEDVTAQSVDLDARIKNAQAEEASYLAVLDKATTVTDILQVQNYLSQVRGTIEELQAEQTYLASQTDYSTITVSMQEVPRVEFGGTSFQPGQAVVDAAHTVVVGFEAFVIGLIKYGIIGLAILIPLALIAWIVMVLYRRFKK